MTMTIEKSERFQHEYSKFKEDVEKIQIPELKQELTMLLGDLLLEVRKVDSAINPGTDIRFAIDNNVGTARSKISEIRKRITKRLEDYKKIAK